MYDKYYLHEINSGWILRFQSIFDSFNGASKVKTEGATTVLFFDLITANSTVLLRRVLTIWVAT